MLAFPAIKTDIIDAQIIHPDLLSLPEGTLFPQHDDIVYVPIPLTLAKTVKPDHIVSINIQPEAVLGVRMERAIGTVPAITSSFETNAQMGLGVIDNRIEIRCGLDVVMGGHGGIYPANGRGVKMDLFAEAGMVGGFWPAGNLDQYND
ncbi:hypothetical protein N9934_04715 [Desulfosarcina sp.]|nr:hypothetical protein [Desulfosarcina sp.]